MHLPGLAAAGKFEKFRVKARAFLRAHQDHLAIHKLRMNKPLTAVDLGELERMLDESGFGASEELARARQESQGLGLFVRSLVGLDREAAKEALAGFLTGKVLTANQIEFVNLIVNHLTEHGSMDASLLYESPFTDVTRVGRMDSSRRRRWTSWWRCSSRSRRERWSRDKGKKAPPAGTIRTVKFRPLDSGNRYPIYLTHF